MSTTSTADGAAATVPEEIQGCMKISMHLRINQIVRDVFYHATDNRLLNLALARVHDDTRARTDEDEKHWNNLCARREELYRRQQADLYEFQKRMLSNEKTLYTLLLDSGFHRTDEWS